MNIKTIKLFNHKMSNIVPPNISPPNISPPNISPHNKTDTPRVPNCRTYPYIMPASIGASLVKPIVYSCTIYPYPYPYTNQNSSSIAKKVTDDLFASSTFFGPKTMTNENYCIYLKEQLNKCNNASTNKREDCRNIKDMYDELC